MSTNRTFQAMLNEYLPNDLLKEEFIKRDYILSNCQKDNSWKGGKVIVPFKSAGASSVRMGKLTAGNDIAEDEYVRGSIDDYKEAWGSMLFNHRDLIDHSGRVNEDSFLKILPGTLRDFMDFYKMVISIQLGTGPHYATVAANGTAGGALQVDRIDRFCLKQKIILKGTTAPALPFYVTNININTDILTLSATRGGAAADVSAYTTADDAKVFTDGADSVSFQSMRDAYLSAANGGSATLHGVTKTSAPYLQSVNIDGSTWTPTNILGKLFDGWTTVRRKAKGRASVILMDYLIGGAVMKIIEEGGGSDSYRGNYNISIKDRKASIYGWDEITLNTVKGELKIVMIQEWDPDIVIYSDPHSYTFRTNGFFRKRKNPEGHEFYETRTEDGYQYIVDTSLFGEMEHTKPGCNGIAYGIPVAAFAAG